MFKGMTTEEMRNALFGMPGKVQYPLEMTLDDLGLDEKRLREFKGKGVLDIGCGEGILVEFLREMGIQAEGIDPHAPSKTYFMRRKINGVYPMAESIPRPDGSYELVVAHSVTQFVHAFSSFRDQIRRVSAEVALGDFSSVDEMLKTSGIEAHLAMLESLRVLKHGGKMIVYPGLDLLEEKMSLEFSGGRYHIGRETVEWVCKEEAQPQSRAEWDLFKMIGCPDGNPEHLKYRTVITKKPGKK
jgi:SAM-dependent methyltransferase